MRFLSLFSGALGLDLGFERAGWECVGRCELDPVACSTIRSNRPAGPLHEGDVRSLCPDSVHALFGVRPGEVDAVVGGPPCQAFSTAGRRRSVQDSRGSVAFHFLGLATAMRPRWIVLENVRGLLSAPLRHRPHAARGAGAPPLADDERPGGALRAAQGLLEGAGYTVSWRLYDASRYGAPQRRERVVLIAHQGAAWPHMPPTNLPGEAPTFREATEGLRVEEWSPLRPHQSRFLHLVGPGENWRALDPALWPEALGGACRAGGGRVGFLRRVAWDEPSPTLVTSPTMPATLLAHPEAMRPLSVEEYRRLQGFPDGWLVAGSTADKYRQLGNAVPAALGEAVARHLLDPRPFPAGARTSRYRVEAHDEFGAQGAGLGPAPAARLSGGQGQASAATPRP